MSEGRLAPVRETDRHASLIAGCVAAVCSAATFAALYASGVTPSLGKNSEGVTTTFPFFVATAGALGLVAGCIEGASAARAARRAAGRFADLSLFARKVFFVSAFANIAFVVIAVCLAYSGTDRAIALACAAIVSVVMSGLGAALFGWSHAVDWPQVPEYMKTGKASATPSKRDTQPRQHEREDAVDLRAEHDRDEVVNEGRSRRSSATSDDELWQEIQDLITGK